MKLAQILLLIMILLTVACSSPENKLVGKWKSKEVNGFVAEFKNDHTGTTLTPLPSHAGIPSHKTIPTPFKWEIDSGNKIKITEAATTYFGKLSGKKLEVNINGAITILEKTK